MSWWGKVLGGALGAAMGGPLGALIGAGVGHVWDRGLTEVGDWSTGRQERIQAAFFSALFGVLGHLAKADGRVSDEEIRMASALMDELALDDEQKAFARNLFRQGKSPDFDLEGVVAQFRQEAGRRATVLHFFMEQLLTLALADGELHPAEQAVLLRVAETLGLSRGHFEALLAMVVARHGYRYHEQRTAGPDVSHSTLEQAYQILGISSDASDEEVRKAYRRQISRHHPDRLIARGVPEEAIRLANETTHKIREAYEQIRAARKTGA